MESNRGDASEILPEIEALKAKRNDIDSKISALGAQLREIKLQNGNNDDVVLNNGSCPAPISRIDSGFGHGLTAEMMYRYSRHLLPPSFGVQGQSNLLKSFVLVVGAGGLGSPALLYLAACGVGRLGIVDHDVVELNHMHRQIIHAEEYIGQPKVKSAAAACFSINSTIKIVEHKETLRTSNALEILSQYDIIVDATDNAPSRYMISDCCVVLGKPLVSGAVVGLEGQFTITMVVHATNAYFQPHHLQQQCQRCSDSGVLGVVPSVIGCLQTLEAIKIASAVGEPLSGRILLFDALSARIRIVKIRGRSSQCKVCGENAAFSKQQFPEFDYEKFTQTPLSPSPLKLNLLQADSRISSKEFRERIVNGESHVLVDVPPEHHFKIVSLPKSLNIPLPSLEARLAEISSALKKEFSETNSGSGPQLYVVCRRGNDSQRAVQYLHNMGFTSAKDIIGGLEGWARTCLRMSRCVNHGS